jgi:hypothetical protein
VVRVLCTDAISLFTIRAFQIEIKGTKGSLRVALDSNGIAAEISHITLVIRVTIFPKKRKHRPSEPARYSASSQASHSTEQRRCFLKFST